MNQFKNESFLSLETFRKNGIGVKTPVWFAQEGDTLYIWTIGDSGKIKRIRNNPQVNIALYETWKDNECMEGGAGLSRRFSCRSAAR